VYVWNFDASSRDGENLGRLFMDNRNSSTWADSSVATDVPSQPGSLPGQFALHDNYPNPFNPATIIEFDLPARAEVRLDVFNILGQKVVTLIDQELPPGPHAVRFDGDGLASGVYLYRLKAGDLEATKKMVLLK
jgi:hypothetical protein